MYEDAQEIFDFLPIETGSESRYIKQLWDAFILLSEGKEDVPYFSIVPFHLLFMLAVQYKAYRLSAWDSQFFLGQINSNQCRTYGSENKQQLLSNIPLNKNSVWDTTQSSVKTLSLIKEKHIFNLFEIVGIDENIKKTACELVGSRNERLHANGEIDEEAENKISEYLKILRHLQEKCNTRAINIAIQGNWAEEIEEGMLSLDEFFQEKFLYSQFSKIDFGEVIGEMLTSKNLNYKQWEQIVDKGLQLSRDKTIIALRNIAKDASFSEEKRFNVMQALFEEDEINDEVDIPLNTNIMDLLQLNNQQKTELRAARIYIKNKAYNDYFINFIIEKQNSNTDVIYKPKNLKFQVVSIDGSPYKLLKNGTYEYSFSAIDTYKIFIEEPIANKTLKYAGRGVDDVILLIHSLNKPLTDKIWEQVIQDNQSSIKDLAERSGFKEICLCFDIKGEIIKLY